MEDPQFDELKSEIGSVQTDNSWIFYNYNELQKLNGNVEAMQESIEENNELLRELIAVIKGQRK